MFASQIEMTTSPSRIEVTIHNDSRLFAALYDILCHSARRAGLSQSGQQGFAEAALNACRETFLLVDDAAEPNGMLRLLIQDFADRVEVRIEHRGRCLPTAGLDTFCAPPTAESGQSLHAALQATKVDRVLYETSNGVSRVTIVKYTRTRPLESSSSA